MTTTRGEGVKNMNTVETLSEEYLTIAQYLDQVEPTVPATGEATSIDVDRSDELIITANGQAW
jgi:hypothetical protein